MSTLFQISCPFDYRLWQQTMYCHFGQKWSKLHHGPLWSVAFSAQSSDSSHDTGSNHSFGRNPIQVRMMQNTNELVHLLCSRLWLISLGFQRGRYAET